MAQYVITVTLPLIAAAIVMSIVVAAAVARNVRIQRCRCACMRSRAQMASALRASTRRLRHVTTAFDMEGLRSSVGVWLHERKHVSTLLFVLFLSYMAIISSSLRALDCTQAIDGTRYVRSDLSVVCYAGQHAVAMFISYIVLVSVGVGFPVLLFVLMARATAVQLSNPTFQSTWGFLYHGYRVNSAMARRVADIAAKLAEAHTARGDLASPMRAPAVTLVQNPLLRAPPADALAAGVVLEHNPLVQPAAEEKHAAIESVNSAPNAHAVMVADAVLIMRSRSRMKRHSIMPKAIMLAVDDSPMNVLRGKSSRLAVALRGFVAFRDLVHDLFVERLIWWEALVLLRKAGIVLISVFIDEPVTQCAMATLLLGGGLVMQLVFQPYEATLFNRLEALSLATAAATATISAVLTQFDVTSANFISETPSAMTDVQWTVTVVLAMINFFTMLVLGGAWLYLLAQQACSYTQRHAQRLKRLFLASPTAARMLRAQSRFLSGWSSAPPLASPSAITMPPAEEAAAAAAAPASASIQSPVASTPTQRNAAVSTRRLSATPRASRPSGTTIPQRRRLKGIVMAAIAAEETPAHDAPADVISAAASDTAAATSANVDERVRREVAMLRSLTPRSGAAFSTRKADLF